MRNLTTNIAKPALSLLCQVLLSSHLYHGHFLKTFNHHFISHVSSIIILLWKFNFSDFFLFFSQFNFFIFLPSPLYQCGYKILHPSRLFKKQWYHSSSCQVYRSQSSATLTLTLFCCPVPGLSILLAPGLHLIPIPVFFGVLLYLGVCSMYGLQMMDRFIMLFMPSKHHPDVGYVRKVRFSWKLLIVLTTNCTHFFTS